MKRKTIATFVIAGLIAMAVLVGPAAADGTAQIFASKSTSKNYDTIFDTINNVYAWGNLGDESLAGHGGRVYIVNYSATWTNGTVLNDVSGGYEIVPWLGSKFFQGILAWPKNLTPGRYDLILDLNCTGHNGVWTKIPDTIGGVI